MSDALTEGLRRYGVGPKLRALRMKRKMRLADLGEHSGLSAALISKIERSRMFPTLPTLLRIANVFSVGLDYFFSHDRPAVQVLRAKDRRNSDASPESAHEASRFATLDFPTQDQRVKAYVADFNTCEIDDVKLHTHEGTEFLYVLQGTLGLYVEDGETTLRPDDAVSFDASRMHGYRRIGRDSCRALCVVTR